MCYVFQSTLLNHSCGICSSAYCIASQFIQLFLCLLQSIKMYTCTHCCGGCGQFCQRMPCSVSFCLIATQSCTLHGYYVLNTHTVSNVHLSHVKFSFWQCCLVTMPLLYLEFCFLIIVYASVMATHSQCYLLCAT
uniref:Uncharacterized protein n=1 Tax=Rhipicephalus zambeziensis TaxID=60191 RepID=A0A224Y883_9ACAR